MKHSAAVRLPVEPAERRVAKLTGTKDLSDSVSFTADLDFLQRSWVISMFQSLPSVYEIAHLTKCWA